MGRLEVYQLIDQERDYQNNLWSVRAEHAPQESPQPLSSWLMYIQDYVREAQKGLTRKPFEVGNAQARDIMRKIAALAVAAIEEHGAPPRR